MRVCRLYMPSCTAAWTSLRATIPARMIAPFTSSILRHHTVQAISAGTTTYQNHDIYMAAAIIAAEHAALHDEVPIGASVIRSSVPPVTTDASATAVRHVCNNIIDEVHHRLADWGHGIAKTGLAETLGAVVATAGNSCRAGTATDHAEMRALRLACAHLGVNRLDGCDMFCTVEPCVMCLGAAALHHIRNVYYAVPNLKYGAVSSHALTINNVSTASTNDIYTEGKHEFAQCYEFRYNHVLSVRLHEGPASAAAKQLMQQFFINKRNKPTPQMV